MDATNHTITTAAGCIPLFRSFKYQTTTLICRSKRPDGETSYLAGARGDASVVWMQPAPGHQLHLQPTNCNATGRTFLVGG